MAQFRLAGPFQESPGQGTWMTFSAPTGRRVQSYQSRLDVVGHRAVALELGQPRAAPILGCANRCVRRAVAQSTTVATDLLGHGRGGSVEASGDVSKGLGRLQSDTNLLAFVRAQYCTCHAGSSNGSSLGVARS